MMNAQSLEQRIGAESYSRGGQSPRVRNGGGQQANAVDQHQLASLHRCKAEAEHAAQILDRHKLRRENVRHTDRIDELCHEHPSQDMDKRGVCKSSAGVSKAYGAHGVQFVKQGSVA